MAALPFDTLKFAKRLKAAGVPDKQAEAEAEALAEVFEVNLKELATKQDLKQLETELRGEIRRLEERVEGRFTLLQWMVGFLLALGIANLWLLIRMAVGSP